MAEVKITKASEVKVREIEWLWYPYIPFGKITVVQGDAGDGKSTFVLNLAAMLSQGQPMPFTDGTGQPPINIIYQSSEDDADDTIVPRFISAGGDPERLLFISEKERYLSFSDERLIQAVRQTGARLVVLDPLSAYIGEETGINAANEVRRQFRPLIEIAREQRCAVLIVHHMNKAIGQKAINRASTSSAVLAVSSSHWTAPPPTEKTMALPVGPTLHFTWAMIRSSGCSEVISQLLSDGPKPQREVMEKLRAAGVGERGSIPHPSVRVWNGRVQDRAGSGTQHLRPQKDTANRSVYVVTFWSVIVLHKWFIDNHRQGNSI